MTTDSTRLQDALLDVRKAFRLLWGYHRRVRDIVELCARILPGTTPRQMFINYPLSETTKPLGSNWDTWECTPTVHWTFLFLPGGRRSKGLSARMVLGMSFIADTAFDDAETSDPDPVEFGPVEGARTVVDLYMYTARSRVKVDWLEMWNELDAHRLEATAAAMEDDEVPSDRYFVYWQRYPLQDFKDKSSVERMVNRFRDEAARALAKVAG